MQRRRIRSSWSDFRLAIDLVDLARSLAAIAVIALGAVAVAVVPTVGADVGDAELRLFDGGDFAGGYLTDVTDDGYIAGAVARTDGLRQPRVIVGSVADPVTAVLPEAARLAGFPRVNAHGTVATAYTPDVERLPGVPPDQKIWIRDASGVVDDRGVNEDRHITGFGGIADDGTVVFTTALPSFNTGQGTPHVVDADGQVTALADPFDSAYFRVYGINDDFALGASFADADDRIGRYVRWDRATGVAERLDPTFAFSTSPAMNRSGAVAAVVGSRDPYDRTVLVWDPSGGYTAFEPIPDAQAVTVWDLTDAGSVFAIALVDGAQVIVEWSPTGDLVDLTHLGDLAGPDRILNPGAVTSSGVIVGSVREPSGRNELPAVVAEVGYVGDPGDDGGPIDGAPTVRLVTDPGHAADGWHNGPVDYSFVCDDDVAVVSCTDGGSVAVEGETVVTGTAVDSDGNRTTTTYVVRIDMTDPQVGIPTRRINPGEMPWERWQTKPVDVTPGCADELSGIVECTEPYTLTETGTHVVSAVAVDAAGNVATTQATIWVDVSPPVVTIVTNNPILFPGSSIWGTYVDANGSGAPSPSGVAATITNLLTGRSQVVYAVVACNADRTNCAWAAPRPVEPGALWWLPQTYSVSVVGLDQRWHESAPATTNAITLF